jgi:hypothetical protein
LLTNPLILPHDICYLTHPYDAAGSQFTHGLVVGSDNGSIVILIYNPSSNQLERMCMDVFGMPSSLSTVPGAYVSVDRNGRGIFMGSLQTNKYFYSVFADAATPGGLALRGPFSVQNIEGGSLMHVC